MEGEQEWCRALAGCQSEDLRCRERLRADADIIRLLASDPALQFFQALPKRQSAGAQIGTGWSAQVGAARVNTQ